MKSSLTGLSDHQEIVPVRRDRINSLQIAASGRRKNIHAVAIGLLAAQKRTSIVEDYTSRARKAYRERRASYYKQSKHKTFKTEFATIHQEGIKALDRFRKMVRMVIILQQAFKNIVFYASERGKHDEITSETAMALTGTSKGTVEDLMFNPEEYKSYFKNTFPIWAKILTTKPPEEKTDEDIRLLIRLMKQLKGFRRYSPEVQLSMCKVLKYDVYNRRRVIIRKGHIAQRLYFIFSGSVCVTVDDNSEDQHSMFSNQSSGGETSVLQRGDYFGELAFLKNFRRAATIVCLERTELLSMDREDFFASGIDKAFARDLKRRMDFLSNHPIFATWPTSTLRSLAEISRIHEYNSEEVLVRDSNNSGWLFLIMKGQCEIVRLLDLSACESYIRHQNRHRGSTEGHTAFPPQSIDLAGYLSPDSPIFKPLLSGDTKEEDDAAISSSISDINIHSSDGGEGTLVRNRTKSAYTRTTRCSNDRSTERGSSVADALMKRRKTKETEKAGWMEKRNGRESEDVGVGVFMAVDKLKQGQLFGAWSIINQEEGRTKKTVDQRRLTLISRGCEIIKISKEGFQKLANPESIATMRQLTRNYPSDEKLCRTYIKLSDWRSYREELVENLMEKKIKEQELVMGLWRTQTSRASPVPSPSCSVRPWQPVTSKWEYFPGSGWEASKVTQPVIQDKNTNKTYWSERENIGSDVIDIFTNEAMENMSLVSRM